MSTPHRYTLMVALGKLEGLAGTIRYELPDECRDELRQIASSLRSLVQPLTESTEVA